MRWSLIVTGLVVCAGVMPARVRAQAWPAPAGTGSVTVSTQVIDNTGHRLSDGSLLPDGKSRNVSGFIDVDYAVTDRVSLSLGIPYVWARYIGPGPTPVIFRPVDECRCWNSGWQNVNAALRYTVLDGVVALTPSIALGVPSHDYLWQGEAVVGFGLKELRLAVDGGVRVDPISTRMAVSTRYQYTVVEDLLGVPNNRSSAGVALSYLLSERLSLRGTATWQRTHGGLRFSAGEASTEEKFAQHDRLLRDNYLHLGAAATYSLPRADLFVSWVEFARGSDTHAGRAVTAGLSVPFQR